MTDYPDLLVVDDERAQRGWVAAVLAPLGWRVAEAADGAEAVALIAERPFALVLMDIQMPVMDGYAATRAIRARTDAAASTPIIAFSALRLEDPDAHFRAAGMDAYLRKPCPAEALVAAAEAWRPRDAPRPRERLGTLMSADDLTGLLSRLRGELADALAAIDRAEGRAATAHRLAGLAGTLGFGDVHKSWIALSEGHDSAREPARIAARLAIQVIDRDLDVIACDRQGS